MTDRPNTTDRLRAWLVMLATIATIAFNSLAAVGYVNGVTPQVISAKYPTVITPAGWAFTIWSVIYAGMATFSVYQLLPANLLRFRAVRTVYILSCLFNCGWIYFWHRDSIGVCLGLIAVLLATLAVLLFRFRESTSFGEAALTKLPFGIYAGWVTAATLVNLIVFLVSIGVELTGQSWNFIGVACLLAGTIAAIFARIYLRNFLFPLAVAWAAAAIAINQKGNTVIIVCSAICVIVCLLLSTSFVMGLKSSTVYE